MLLDTWERGETALRGPLDAPAAVPA